MNYICLYAFAVGEDGDILNLGEKKKKKKKKQTSEVVVRFAHKIVSAYTARARLQGSTLLQEDAFAEATAGGEEEADIIPELGLDKKKKKKKKREVACQLQKMPAKSCISPSTMSTSRRVNDCHDCYVG